MKNCVDGGGGGGGEYGAYSNHEFSPENLKFDLNDTTRFLFHKTPWNTTVSMNSYLGDSYTECKNGENGENSPTNDSTCVYLHGRGGMGGIADSYTYYGHGSVKLASIQGQNGADGYRMPGILESLGGAGGSSPLEPYGKGGNGGNGYFRKRVPINNTPGQKGGSGALRISCFFN